MTDIKNYQVIQAPEDEADDYFKALLAKREREEIEAERWEMERDDK